MGQAQLSAGVRVFALLLAVMLSCGAVSFGTSRSSAAARGDAGSPSAQELQRLIEQLIANTHRNDAALEQYERIEHWVERASEKDPRVRFDKTYRVFPTGTGTLRLLLKENGASVAASTYLRELKDLEYALGQVLQPQLPGQQKRIEKFKGRVAARYQAVESFRNAYTVTWLGRETREGQPLQKIHFEPKLASPEAAPGADLLSNSRVTVWLNSEAQPVRFEAELLRDLAFGGGLLGKIYKGGHISIDQMEVAPGLWMPRDTRYEAKGRKFLFSVEQWRAGEASDYRRVGPPAEAMPLVKGELARLEGHARS
jgi:hypothetical protein